MAEFFVDATGLRDYIGLVVQTNLRTSKARSYAEQWVASQGSSGGLLFSDPAKAVQALGQSAADFVDKLHWVGIASVTALEQSATMYSVTEQANLEAADRMLPSAQYGYNSGGGQ